MKLDKCLSKVADVWQTYCSLSHKTFSDPPRCSLVLYELTLRDDLAQLPDETRSKFDAYFAATNIKYVFYGNASLSQRRAERALWVWTDSRTVEAKFTGSLIRDLEAR